MAGVLFQALLKELAVVQAGQEDRQWNHQNGSTKDPNNAQGGAQDVILCV